jgi:hypothetical protein
VWDWISSKKSFRSLLINVWNKGSFIADVAIPTWFSLVCQAVERVIDDLVGMDKAKADHYQQKMNQLWEELRGKTRDEKLPFVIELAKEVVADAKPILNAEESESLSLSMLEKVITDRKAGANDRIISLVDSEARTGHKSDMRTIQGYKDHIMIDEESEIITSVKFTPANAEDGDQLVDLLNQFKEAHGKLPEEVSADKAYWSGKNLRYLEQTEVVGHISVMKTKQHTAGLQPR